MGEHKLPAVKAVATACQEAVNVCAPAPRYAQRDVPVALAHSV